MVRGRKLLLADDSVTIQKVVDLTFADEGMQVTTVSDGLEAIEKLKEIAPDIVLADVYMPRLNGYEVCEHIKRHEQFRHIPVMLLVGSFEPFDEAEARRVGADDFLTKPFQSIRQLVSKVSALLGGSSTEKEADTKDFSKATAAAPANQASVDRMELTTADTAPLPLRTRDEMGKRATREDSFADLTLDDEMIEATAPPGDFSGPGNASGVNQGRVPTAAGGGSRNASVRERAGDSAAAARVKTEGQIPEASKKFSMKENVYESSSKQSVAPARVSADPVATEDDLLDLGDFQPPAAAAAADDFILDLREESPPQRKMPRVAPAVKSAEGASLTELGAAREAAPRSIGRSETTPAMGDEHRAASAPIKGFSSEKPGDQVGRAAINAATTIGHAAGVSTQRSDQINLDQLSPEAMDAIARRVVEHLSAKVVEEIAWEVVPQLAELLIKRRLEEERSRTQ